MEAEVEDAFADAREVRSGKQAGSSAATELANSTRGCPKPSTFKVAN
jgi:hypothetical protein